MLMIFSEALQKRQTIFKDNRVFEKSWIPKNILHRDDEIKEMADNLAHALRGDRAEDMMLYGKRGVGKTLVTKYVISELNRATEQVKTYYISLREKKTRYAAWREIGRVVIGKETTIKDTGAITNQVFDALCLLEQQSIILVIDEVNEVEEGYDNLLYFLLRPHEVAPKIATKKMSCIFITNDLKFPTQPPYGLSEGTLSSFKCMDKFVYPPYNAPQLRDILSDRAREGLIDGAYDETVIPMCAAYAAQENGDAREAIKILAKAAELASRNGAGKITETDVKKARDGVEFDGMTKVLNTLPTHQKTLALACIRDYKSQTKEDPQKGRSKTTTVYIEYKGMCKTIGIEPLGYRRIADFLGELETMGFIAVDTVYSRGRSNKITVLVPLDTERVLTEDYRLKPFKDMPISRPRTTLDQYRT